MAPKPPTRSRRPGGAVAPLCQARAGAPRWPPNPPGGSERPDGAVALLGCRDDAAALFGLGQAGEVEAAAGRVQGGPEIAEVGDAGGDVVHAEVLELEAA